MWCDATIAFLSIYIKASKSASYRDTSTSMVIVVPTIIAKLWHQSWCPLRDEDERK